MICVIDTSFVAALFLPDDAQPAADKLAKLIVRRRCTGPAQLQAEVTELLLTARRTGALSGQQFWQLSTAWDDFPVTFQPPLTAAQRAEQLRLAEQHELTSYDAAYLELAVRLNLPLATISEPLASAAKAEGVKLALKGASIAM